MVAKMKKFTFLIYHKEYNDFLKDLRELGLMHVVENRVNQRENQHLEAFNAQYKQLSEAKKTLQKYTDKKSPVQPLPANGQRGHELPREIETLQNERTQLLQQLQVTTKERNALLPWGSFDPEVLHKFAREGYYIQFFTVSENRFNPEWESLYNAMVVNTQSSKVYFITMNKKADISQEIELEPIKMPEVSADSLDGLVADLRQKIEGKEAEIQQLTAEIPSLDAALEELQHNINYKKVEVSGNKLAEDKIMLLQGYAPDENSSEIAAYLESKNAYFEMSDPAPEDDVPIKFKNNRFARLFEPIAELYMLPKYNEIDLTPYFAPFYMFFFGLSLGDIGYGLFLLVVATVAKILKKASLGKTMIAILSLVQILGASTMIAGLLTGGFFGFKLYDLDIPLMQTLKSKLYFDNNQMFMLSLVLGVVQIMFGMCMKVANRIKQLGFVHALSTIGWVVFLLSCIVAAMLPQKMPLFGTLHLVFAIPAAILIFFFNSPGKNPFMNLGLGLWDTYNMATGLLGDVLSYVRLFALGLSGGILASVFNSLAAGMSPDNAIAGPIVAILIFLIGHAINIFMNTLGAIVHPVRLTFVEFYKNAEFEGGGQKYSPFRK